MANPSYHDIHITTASVKRTSIFDLPFNVRIMCTRSAGWELWNIYLDENLTRVENLIASEYCESPDTGLRLDVAGHVIIDSLTEPTP